MNGETGDQKVERVEKCILWNMRRTAQQVVNLDMPEGLKPTHVSVKPDALLDLVEAFDYLYYERKQKGRKL